MSLEESQVKLADAMTKYAAVMERMLEQGVVLIVPADHPAVAGAAAGETKAPGKRRTQAEIAAAAKAEVKDLAAAGKKDETTEIDPFAEDEPAGDASKVYTADDIRKLILGVKAKDAAKALEIIKGVGVATLSQIPEAEYPKVASACAKLGVTL